MQLVVDCTDLEDRTDWVPAGMAAYTDLDTRMEPVDGYKVVHIDYNLLKEVEEYTGLEDTDHVVVVFDN